MSQADIKREWDKKMRNADGRIPGEPKRKPVVIYLSDEARKVISDERHAAKEAQLSPVLTSKLIEDLLRFHAANPLREERAGLSETALREQIDMVWRRAREAVERLERLQTLDEHKTRANMRTIRRLMEAEAMRPRASAKDLQELFQRMSRMHSEVALSDLREGIQTLFKDYASEAEQTAGMRRLVDRYVSGLMGLRDRRVSGDLNWKAPRRTPSTS